MEPVSDFLFAAATDAKFPGKTQNQDAILAAMGQTGGGIPYGLFVVADGVGGLKDGSRASQTVIATLAEHFEPIWPVITAVSDQTITRLRQQLKKAILKANAAIQNLAAIDEERMASTITCAITLDKAMIAANAGDSRTYLFRQNQLKQITQDHSLVAWLLRQEHITAEQALTHPYKNVLMQALGATDKPQIDLFTQRLFPGDWLLLCSDGIWGTLTDEQLTDYLQTAVSPEQLVPILMQDAQNHSDDLSVVLIHLPVT
ncbi:MAG: serine/threonine-protein phosphatase [Ardenticatenaceae bacterium]|nr:serine/threonine-protein phosphatase [Ardenticatenaceae bacterium]MCB8946690.1 serine/threonine-protein phosphatase [Ardenticatenaceae bacterium]